jgi:hypothetical protein
MKGANLPLAPSPQIEEPDSKHNNRLQPAEVRMGHLSATKGR